MSAETLAIIDLGTNTFHLLIAEVSDRDEYAIREKFKEPVNMAEGGITSGQIGPKAFERGIRALKRFRKLIESKNAGKVFAFATSAIRGAENGKEFIQRARQEAGIEIRVINGNEEASLIYEGVKNGVVLPYETESLLVDIGGGSVEFIVVREGKPKLLRSLDIGAARMLELVHPSDPITPEQMEQARAWYREKMKGLLEELRQFDIRLVVGSSGTFETLAAMIAHTRRDFLSAENLNSYRFTRAQFKRAFRRLVETNREDRLAIPGMEPMRVDLILTGSLLVDFILDELNQQEIMISLNALKEGILYHYIEEKRERINHLIGHSDRNLRAKAIRNLGRKYHYQQDHALKTSEIALSLYDQLQPLHHLGEVEKELLKYACMLHDIGYFVNRSGHHKHGQYLIMNSGLSGFSNDELIIIGNVVRYHRKSLPSRDHFHFKILKQEHRTMVRVLAGILRIADNLDRGHRHLVESLMVHISSRVVSIMVDARGTVDIEVNAAMENRELLEQVLGRTLIIRQGEREE